MIVEPTASVTLETAADIVGLSPRILLRAIRVGMLETVPQTKKARGIKIYLANLLFMQDIYWENEVSEYTTYVMLGIASDDVAQLVRNGVLPGRLADPEKDRVRRSAWAFGRNIDLFLDRVLSKAEIIASIDPGDGLISILDMTKLASTQGKVFDLPGLLRRVLAGELAARRKADSPEGINHLLFPEELLKNEFLSDADTGSRQSE